MVHKSLDGAARRTPHAWRFFGPSTARSGRHVVMLLWRRRCLLAVELQWVVHCRRSTTERRDGGNEHCRCPCCKPIELSTIRSTTL